MSLDQAPGDTDTGSDTDTDVDTDTDIDSDSDSDTDTDTDTDTDSDTDSDTCAEVICEDPCVFRVDADVETPCGGLTWETAFATVQEGIDAAAACPWPCQVWVAEGTYYIHDTSPNDTVQLAEGVEVYGGFDATETELDERDWELNQTVLHGSDVVYHVVTGAEDARLDGFTVTAGNAFDSTDPYNEWNANNQGGGMYVSDVTLEIANCTFAANFAVRGGGLYLGYSHSIVTNCAFVGNLSTEAGGASVINYSPSFDQCTFDDNTAEQGGGGMKVEGAPVQITGCAFEHNQANSGGAIKFTGDLDGSGIEHCSFIANEALSGGALSVVEHMLSIWWAVFEDNSALGPGGAIMLGNHGDADIHSAVFRGNQAVGAGGAIRVTGTDSCLDICNSTFASNSTELLSGGALSSGSDLGGTVLNTVLWGNEPDEIEVSSGDPSITYCDVEGGYSGAGNIDADPLFVDLDGGDLHLQAGSPCIDAADGPSAPGSDLDGNPLMDAPDTPNTGIGPPWADIGAFEYQP
jgi:predicted outer membrane repeat protein